MKLNIVTAAALAVGLLLTAQCYSQDPVPAEAKKVQSTTKAPSATTRDLVDAKLPVYVPLKSGISGNLNSVGSDTLNNLMTFWCESFQKMYPNVRPQVEGKGSATAPPALISGSAQLGPMSRKMKSKEKDGFEKKFGYQPTELKVAIDALAVFVHKDNPLGQITLAQVDAVFSKARKGGHKTDITTWGDLGLKGEWADKPIRLYGRNSASGTYGYFKDVALFKGDFKDTVKEAPGSAGVVSAISEDKYGIGYSGIGYSAPGVKTLALAAKDGGEFYSTEVKNVESRKYPLSRFLLIYVNKAPNKPSDPLIQEFIRFVLSKQGQEIVVKDGYIPLSSVQATKVLSTIL